MNIRRNRLASLLLGTAFGLAAWPAVADDTELFVASTDPEITGAQPNILFIVDNSGSMSSTVLTQEDWDPDTTFTGCYGSNRLYFSTTGTMPACGSGNYVNKTANRCYASFTPLKSVGSFSDRMLAWRSFTQAWVALSGSSSSTRDRPVECQDDRGLHGSSTGDGQPWAAAGANGPWDDAANNEPSWNTDYTVWDGNWLNWYSGGGTVTKTRMEIVREVAIDLLEGLNGVNVGLMHFNYDQGGTVSKAIENIATSRAAMQSAVGALTASTWTPLSETLYEAANYYMGRNVDYGNVGPVQSVAGARVGNVITGTQYAQPVSYACQKNYIVLLTDGLPTQDVGATAKIKGLPNWATNVTDATCRGTPGGHGECMADLAEYLHRHDLNGSLTGLQNITTYTIGFGVDLALDDTTFLQETASAGGGQYFSAGDTATLQAALTQIIYDILDDATTFSTPTAPVNAFNRMQNLSDVYVSVFAPAVREHWPGNLKKYRLDGGRLVDANNNSAVDIDTGFFTDTSQSFWSDGVDGNTAQLGGAANEQPAAASRNVYTDIAGTDLNATGNAVATGNSAITASVVGAPDDATKVSVIDWARGLDLLDEDDDGSTSDERHVMGDPLHVRPMMVIYGGTASAPDATVFVSTNDGYLHAVDPDDGSELWAYLPAEMLGRLYGLYLNQTTDTRSYGLDGEISVYIENEDATPGIAGEERVILLFGMRRGGDTLFALDVTDRNNPQLMWKLDSDDADFTDLGQTWSPPVVADIDIDGEVFHAAIFGGGYDDGQDDEGYNTDARGNAVYMVDVLTGKRLWSAGDSNAHDLVLTDMTHSIPAGIRVLDIDGDRYADRMYVGDMGGRVWRFDISNGKPVAELVNGGVLASLGAADLPSPTLADVRRFYATPDVARIVSGKTMYLSVHIGSGHREHPLDTATDDEFYALRDYNVFDTIATDSYPAPITRSDLEDITSDVDPVIPAGSKGWRLGMDLSPGEKVLTESRTFANTVIFSSFSPGGNGDACVAAGGLNRLYLVSVRDGSPITNLDGSEEGQPLTADDRTRTLNQGGIAPDPALFFSPPDDNPDPDVECLGPDCDDDGDGGDDDDGTQETLCIGVECFNPGFPNPPRRTHWNQTGTE